jgi:rubrerythrin
MPSLRGTETEQNLKDAFASERQANRRCLCFGQKAHVEGVDDAAAVFRSTAESKTRRAHGHLEYLEEVRSPATREPIGRTVDNLTAAIASETHESTDMYTGMPVPPAGKASRRSPTGSRRSPGPGSPMPPAFERRSTRFEVNGPYEQFEADQNTIGEKHGRKA